MAKKADAHEKVAKVDIITWDQIERNLIEMLRLSDADEVEYIYNRLCVMTTEYPEIRFAHREAPKQVWHK